MKLSRPQYGLEQEIVEAIFALRQKKSSQIFRQAVDVSKVPDYFDYIKKPMDLSKILTKLKAGQYQTSQNIYQDLLLIIQNCKKYNRADSILKKADQFKQCISTVWGNFKRQIIKKHISYDQKIIISQQSLKRINFIEQKRTKKKIPALQAVIEQQKKNILPQSSILPPIESQLQKNDRQQLPPGCYFQAQRYLQMDRQIKTQLVNVILNTQRIMEQFQQIVDKKLMKYRKIIKKKLLWFDEKIIKKCLKKSTFQKMQVPRHLNTFIQDGNIADQLNIRKLQMYVKKITYWVEDNSSILSDYMKDKFVENCRLMKKCILRVLKYKRNQKNRNNLDFGLQIKAGKNEMSLQINGQVQKQEDNYENKMKQFKRMLDRDREKSTKRDTKIILRNQNGVMQVFDWMADKKQDRIKKQGGMGAKIQQVDNDQKKKQQQRKKQELKKDQQFLQDYSKKSNTLLILKYGDKLSISWESAKKQNFFEIQSLQLNLTDDDNH